MTEDRLVTPEHGYANPVSEAQEVLDRLRETHEESHPDVVEAMKQLAVTYLEVRQPVRARDLLTQVLAEQWPGAESPTHEALDTAHRFGAVLFRLGDVEAARRLQERVLSACIARDGLLGEATLVELGNLCISLVALGKFTELGPAGNAIIDARLQSAPPDSPSGIFPLYFMAGWWRYIGELKRASGLYRRVVRDCLVHRTGMSMAARSLCAQVFLVLPGLVLLRFAPDDVVVQRQAQAVAKYQRRRRSPGVGDTAPPGESSS